MKTKIGVVFGGRSAEHKVSVVSARTVASALEEAGFDVVPLGVAQDGCWVPADVGGRALAGEVDVIEPVGEAVRASLRHFLAAEVDVAFPIVHGTWGEDGTLQGLFEMADLPYVGTGVASSAVCMDKILAKQVLSQAGLAVVDYESVTRRQATASKDEVLQRLDRFEGPVFVKPAIGGSSVGVTKVTSADGLWAALEHGFRFDERLLVEKGIDGRELECAVLGYGELRASGVGEIVPGKEFYDYADKYIDDGAELIERAELTPQLEDEIRAASIAAMEAVGGWGMARVDFLLDDEGLYINEINTLPGFTSISMYPTLWDVAGVSLPSLVEALVEAGRRRHAEHRRLDEGIKDWISSLGAP